MKESSNNTPAVSAANLKAKEAAKTTKLDKTTYKGQVSYLNVSKSTLGKCQNLLDSLKNRHTPEQELTKEAFEGKYLQTPETSDE